MFGQSLADFTAMFDPTLTTVSTDPDPAWPGFSHYGVALLAAVGAGAYKNIQEACAATIRVVSQTSPQRAAAKTYDRAFPVYQDLYRSLKDDFKRIAALAE